VTTRILTVEDDERIRTALRLALEDEGWEVDEVASGEEALVAFGRVPADVVLVDIMLPGIDGFDICRAIRKSSDVPIVMITARSDTHDVVAGLEAGADDYLTKPFSPRELVSRIRALFRRIEATEPPRLQSVVVDDWLTINFDQSLVIADGREKHLRPTEYRLLYQLVNNSGQLISHDTLLERVWGPEYKGEHQYVRTYVTYLRQKLERDPRNPEYILSERGLGYRFKELGH
jgi:DNA-binding response OmpR family regulator